MARALIREIKDTRKNYIINGDMRIAQRNTSFTSIGSGIYNLDRWRYSKAGAMVHNLTQDTDVPTVAQAGYLFQNSLRMNLTTPDIAIAASDNMSIDQSVEGYNWANLAQKTFTLSFWVKATLVGTYCVGFRNNGNDRSYVAEYTIDTTNTWEYKVITVSASPSAGTWNYTNGIGLDIRWMLAAGTTFHTTAGAWQTGNFLATANQVNGVNTGATDFRITGVMLNEGSYAAPFKLFGEDIEGEIRACQRYYEKTYDLTTVPGTVTFTGAVSNNFPGTGGSEFNHYFKVSKRVNANPVYYNPQTGATGTFRDTTNSVDRATSTLRTGQHNIAYSTSGIPAGQPDISGHIVADTEL